MRYYETYKCGCTSPLSAKCRLAGYCAQHGSDASGVYRQNGFPADEAAKTIVRETLKAKEAKSNGR